MRACTQEGLARVERWTVHVQEKSKNDCFYYCRLWLLQWKLSRSKGIKHRQGH